MTKNEGKKVIHQSSAAPLTAADDYELEIENDSFLDYNAPA